MKRLRSLFIAALGIAVLSQTAFAATYKVDLKHSTVGFKIKHLFSNVIGAFREFEGVVEYDPEKPDSWKVNATVQAASIDTNVKERDNHLRTKDFFDVEQFPTLTFVSTGVTDATAESAKLNGDLTIHGVTKPVTFDLQINGVGKDPWGNVKASFSATTKINRKDFGLTWNQAVEAGQLLVGEEVTIILEVEADLQQ